MDYTLHAVNTLLLNLIQETDRFHSGVKPTDYPEQSNIRAYLKLIRKGDGELSLLEREILDSVKTKEGLAERLRDVVEGIIMIQGPVDSLRKLGRVYADARENVLKAMDRYSEALQDTEEEIEQWVDYLSPHSPEVETN